MKNEFDCIVIGAGPAGLLAAGTAASGKKVLLLDQNKMIGKKLRITGKGRCNITNTADLSDFFDHIPHNSTFLYSALYSFDNRAVMDFFEQLGLPLKEERGGRVFPQSDKALDVVLALERFINRQGVVFRCETVRSISVLGDGHFEVETSQSRYPVSSVVIATGGMSYPLTGSTGDGYRFARRLGHRVTALLPSLVPVETVEEDAAALQGLALKNIAVRLIGEKGKPVYEDFGELLFTHFGLSGPVILSLSAHIQKNAAYHIEIDLKPALTEEQLDKRMLRDFGKNIKKQFSNSLGELLPKKLIPVMIARSGIPAELHLNCLTKSQRRELVHLFKHLTYTVKGLRPIGEAIITSGGVSTKEINPSTMESKLVPGLYFAGEVIDVDGYTGGFNLQIAFSTGYLAGNHIKER